MNTPPPLPDTVKKLGWVSFFTDFASEMAYPVVPLFLTSALGAPAIALGAIEGVAEAVVSLMKGLSGLHCDRTGRRVPYIRLGYSLGASSKLLLALAFAWPMVFVARVVDRLGKGLRTTARDALVAEAVEGRMTGRAYGFHRMMDTSGAIVGALAALLLLHVLPERYRTVFLLAVLPGAVAVWLTFRLREPRREGLPGEARACAPPPSWKGLPAGYWRTLLPLTVFALGNSSDAFLLLRAKNLGLSDTRTILAYVLFNLTYAVSSYPFGALSDRYGRWRMILAGWVIYAGVYLGFAQGAGLWLIFAIYGLYMGLTEGVGKALIASQVPRSRYGAAIGLFQMSIGFAALASSLVAGWLWDRLGPAAPFRFGAMMALAAILALLLLAPWRTRPH